MLQSDTLLIHETPSRLQPDIIRSFGYPVEEHWVTTSDGYILALHRVPSGHPAGPHPKGGGVPVLLGHCLIGSSAIFSWGPANTSMAYVFADRGEISADFLFIIIKQNNCPIF